MSDTQASDAVTVTSDGVTVTKRFEADEFPVPAIAFVFESSRDRPVSVRLTDAVPEDVDVGDLGFHPEYGSEYWSLEDDRIAFEYELGPAAEYTTVYGLRATGTENVERFLTEPVLESVEPARDEASADGADAGDAAESRGNVTGSNASSPDVEASGAADDEAADPVSADATAAATGAASLVASMADELRSGDVTQDDVRVLREALDRADEGSTVARVRKLQNDVDDLLAYKDTLEEFLDETGSGAIVEDVQDDLGAHQQAIDDLQGTTETLRDDMSTVINHVDSVEASVAEMEERIEEIESHVEDVQSAVEDADLADRVDALEAWRKQLSTAVGDE